jgi:hypothetical protein
MLNSDRRVKTRSAGLEGSPTRDHSQQNRRKTLPRFVAEINACAKPIDRILSISDGNPMTNLRRILVVDDDADIRDALVALFALHPDIETVLVDSHYGCRASRH